MSIFLDSSLRLRVVPFSRFVCVDWIIGDSKVVTMSLLDHGRGVLGMGQANLNMVLARLRPIPPLPKQDLTGKQIIVTGANQGEPWSPMYTSHAKHLTIPSLRVCRHWLRCGDQACELRLSSRHGMQKPGKGGTGGRDDPRADRQRQRRSHDRRLQLFYERQELRRRMEATIKYSDRRARQQRR